MSAHGVCLLYWGKRGGGLEIFHGLISEAGKRNFPILISSRPEYIDKFGRRRVISFFNILSWLESRRSLIKSAKYSDLKFVFIVMSSPWDFLLGRALKKHGVTVVRIIHDATRHPGDVFPPNMVIRHLIKDCSYLITLSGFVANRLIQLYGIHESRVHVLKLPPPNLSNYFEREYLKKRKILLIGRGRKYQGQEIFEKAVDLISDFDVEPVIAGAGFRNNGNPKITYKVKWLEKDEFVREISNSAVVVFPYLEASQSGTIPLCIALRIPVVVTPVGGLIEQVENGVDGIISPSLDPANIAESIRLALTLEPRENHKTVSEQYSSFFYDTVIKPNL